MRTSIFFLTATLLLQSLVSLGQAPRPHNVISTILNCTFHYPDRSNNKIFSENEELKGILVSYYDYEPLTVQIYYDDFESKNPKTEFYDLRFSGDSCLLIHKYGTIQLRVPKLDINYIEGKKENRNLVVVAVSRIKKDSVSHQFYSNYLPDGMTKKTPYGGIGGSAKLKTNLEVLEESISQQLRATTLPDEIDSTIVFRAEITKEGQLKDLELLVGQKSSFSDIVENELQKRANNWKPAYMRQAVQSYVRIFAQLNSNGSVRLETPRILGSFTGE